jgi:hypothetical protein
MQTVSMRRSVAAPIDEVFDWIGDGYMSYKVLSSTPRLEHDGGSITFKEIPVGTEVVWTTTFRVTTPVFAGLLTRLYARLLPMGMEGVARTAERALTR